MTEGAAEPPPEPGLPSGGERPLSVEAPSWSTQGDPKSPSTAETWRTHSAPLNWVPENNVPRERV